MRYILTGFLSFFLFCTAVSAHAPKQITTFITVPAGFTSYTVQQGDTWESITANSKFAFLAMKVNRVDAKHLKSGMTVIIPVSTMAYQYVPVPKRIEAHAERQLIVFLEEQYFGAYENGTLVHWGPVSSGKNGRTRVGSFKALWKDRWHRSSKYGLARMFFAVQYNGDYFTHEQDLPGYAASHGCVRMLAEDASWKFQWIQVGDAVTIVAGISSL
ncbi:MAG: lipoprotein-anchoring transpeptidase ErfK/SrfK [Acidimicrobiales bacterium]|jgi:lipoprotein-anchoring transpeptidase ErfK/SrfK